MKELPYSKAKDAIKRSKSQDDIRTARSYINELEKGRFEAPRVFPGARELLEAYVARKSLPYELRHSARVYLSQAGKIQYDAVAVGTDRHKTHLFGISENETHMPVQGLQIREFNTVMADAPLDQPSVTNIVHIDDGGLVVYKAFLNKAMAVLSRENKSRWDAEDDTGKAVNEVEQLAVLAKALANNTTLCAPCVLGRSDAVVAIEFMQGDNLGELVSRNAVSAAQYRQIGRGLYELHEALAKTKDGTETQYPSPIWHSANTITFFDSTAVKLSEQNQRALEGLGLLERFLEMRRKAEDVLVNNSHYRNFSDLIYGDFKDENMIAVPTGKFAIFDPMICMGRRSMDVGGFLRSVLFKNPQAYADHHRHFIEGYTPDHGGPVYEKEIAHMTGIGLLNMLRAFLTIPAESLHHFPPYVNSVRQRNAFYFDFIDGALEGEAAVPIK